MSNRKVLEIPYLEGKCPDTDKHYRNTSLYHGCSVPDDFNPNTGRSKTMIQVRCPTCHFYKCWVPKGEEKGEYAVYK